MKGKTSNTADIAKLYATLVGRVDNAITVLEQMAAHQEFDWYHVTQVTEMLKSALLEAEEAYIEAEEEEEETCLLILPHGPTEAV